MASVGTFLNFAGKTEEAFAFYKTVFGTEYAGPIMRFNELPAGPEGRSLPPELGNLIMHIALPILGGHTLHGSDVVAEFGFTFTPGNTVHIHLETDTRAQAEGLFAALSHGGKIMMPLQEQFWGALYAHFQDQFGTSWMIHCMAK